MNNIKSGQGRKENRKYLTIICQRQSKYLTIILWNQVEYCLIPSRRGRRPSWLKSRDIPQDWAGYCFIIEHIDNKAQVYSRKAGGDLYLLKK